MGTDATETTANLKDLKANDHHAAARRRARSATSLRLADVETGCWRTTVSVRLRAGKWR